MIDPRRALLVAELTAGGRSASRYAVPHAHAFARPWSRLVAGLVLRLARVPLLDQFAIREEVFYDLLVRRLATEPHGLLVDIGSGFSTLGYRWAQARPDCQVFELDLPEVSERKRQRVEALGRPANWRTHGLDLERQPLSSVLAGARARVLVAQGVFPYFSEAEIAERLGRWRRECLLEDGLVLFDLLDAGFPGSTTANRRQGLFKSRFDSPAAAVALLHRAGFSQAEVLPLNALGAAHGWPNPGPNGLFVCVGECSGSTPMGEVGV